MDKYAMKAAIMRIHDEINSDPNNISELDDRLDERLECVSHDDYLLRFSRRNSDGIYLVLMGDWGITWEPAGYCRTPCYAKIDPNNPKCAVKIMLTIFDAYYKGKLPRHPDKEQALVDK